MRITESNAILRHIGRKHGLDGKTEAEKVHIDMVENITFNLHMQLGRVCVGPDFVSLTFIFFLETLALNFNNIKLVIARVSDEHM